MTLKNKTLLIIAALLVISAGASAALADSFCRDVLDSFDFEQGVFAGPDPDAVPNRIHEYIGTRVQNQVNKGQLTQKEADYFQESAIDELKMFPNIADICRREPNAGIRLIDKLLQPNFQSGRLAEHQTETGNRQAHETLDAVWKACQIFWMEQDIPALCTLKGLRTSEGNLLVLPVGLEVEIEDGSMTGFRARARHRSGNRDFMMNAQGDIFETVLPDRAKR